VNASPVTISSRCPSRYGAVRTDRVLVSGVRYRTERGRIVEPYSRTALRSLTQQDRAFAYQRLRDALARARSTQSHLQVLHNHYEARHVHKYFIVCDYWQIISKTSGGNPAISLMDLLVQTATTRHGVRSKLSASGNKVVVWHDYGRP
jgi:hypothetical protein